MMISHLEYAGFVIGMAWNHEDTKESHERINRKTWGYTNLAETKSDAELHFMGAMFIAQAIGYFIRSILTILIFLSMRK